MRTHVYLGSFAAVCLFANASTVIAQPPDASAADKLLYDSLKEMHNKAADLYNTGDSHGCYRMFQGGLYMARPFLAHRPDVQQLIDQGMQTAEKMPSVPQRARALHDTIEQVRSRLKPPGVVQPANPVPPANPPGNPSTNPPGIPPAPGSGSPLPPAGTPMPPAGTPPSAAGDTLWKRLGGEAGVTKIVDNWLAQALVDPRVNFTRGDRFKLDKQKEAELKLKLVAYISSISDGTVVPTSSRSLAEAHKGMNIQGAEFDAFVKCLKSAMETNNVTATDVGAVLTKVIASRKDLVAGD